MICKSTYPFIGDKVFIYSTSLNEVIEGVIEGYADESRRRYKILQEIAVEESNLRHIVSYIYIFRTYEEALICKEEHDIKASTDIKAGNVVYLLDKLNLPVSDRYGIPCQYQVVAVYRDTRKVGLVTSYGEYIGTHDIDIVLYLEEGPLFKKEDYDVGNPVVWIDNEDIYEGIIEVLHDSTASIKSVKKLYPVDYKVRIPYWKIPEGRKACKESTPLVLHTIIGDDLD